MHYGYITLYEYIFLIFLMAIYISKRFFSLCLKCLIPKLHTYDSHIFLAGNVQSSTLRSPPSMVIITLELKEGGEVSEATFLAPHLYCKLLVHVGLLCEAVFLTYFVGFAENMLEKPY